VLKFIAITLLSTAQLLAAGGAEAQGVPFYVPGTENGTFGFVHSEPRETLFRANESVMLSELGAIMDPANGTNTFRWQLFASDSSGTFGGLIFSRYDYYDDVGLATYSTEFPVGLIAGNYYILRLENFSGATAQMQYFREVDQGLPFDTRDGNFEILDGGAYSDWGNTILPAFVVDIVRPVPFLGLPGIVVVVLLLSGLGFLMLRRERSI